MPTTRNQRRRRRAQRKKQEAKQDERKNLAAHFAELTNAILAKCDNSGIQDDLLEQWTRGMKHRFIHDLKHLYNKLLAFDADPTGSMPPPLATKEFRMFTPEYDVRLGDRYGQLCKNTIDFLESLGFVIKKHPFPSDRKMAFISVDIYIDRSSFEGNMTSINDKALLL